MSNPEVNSAVAFALAKIKSPITLKKEQLSSVSAILDGKDVLAVLPTGYGKSLIYQLLPDCFDYKRSTSNSIVIVVSPLNALMQDQIGKLNQKGVISCMVRGMIDTEMKDPKCQLLFLHPEICVDNKTFRCILQSEIYQRRVVAIVVDEAHLVKEWQSFRPAYGKLDVLCSLFPKVPHIALTATATKLTQTLILQSLGMKDTVIIQANPDRPNIHFRCNVRPYSGEDKLAPILKPIVDELRKMKEKMPLTIIYGNLSTCSDCFSYFNVHLGNQQYYPVGADPIAKNRLFSQFHAEYPDHEKMRILEELTKGICTARVLFVTVVFGIGVDIPNIRHVVHIGVPKSMEEFFQEAGRAGRDGEPAVASLYYNGHDIRKGKGAVDDVMRNYATTTECKREVILSYFGFQVPQSTAGDLHTCCDYHQSICECSTCILSIVEKLEQSYIDDIETNVEKSSFIESKEITCTSYQLNAIRSELEDYCYNTLPLENTCVGSVTFCSGFSLELIELTLEKCNKLKSLDDVMEMLPVFSRANAQVIFDIVRRYIPLDC